MTEKLFLGVTHNSFTFIITMRVLIMLGLKGMSTLYELKGEIRYFEMHLFKMCFLLHGKMNLLQSFSSSTLL